MNKKLLKNLFVVAIILVVTNILLFVGVGDKLVTDTFRGLNTVIDEGEKFVTGLKTNFTDSKKSAQLNIAYAQQIKELTSENQLLSSQNALLLSENTQLKGNATSTTNSLLNSEVINRNINSWNNTVTINKGSADGVEINNPVIYQGVYLGKVSKVDKSSSDVNLMTSENVMTNEPAMVLDKNNKQLNGIIRSYTADSNTYVFESFTQTSSIEVGNPVYTNGYSAGVGSGIIIGTVTNIYTNDSSIYPVYEVTPATDLINAREVQVILNAV